MINKNTIKAEGMNKETLAYFMSGLQHFIKESGMTQNDVALKAGTTGVTLSKYVNQRGTPSKEWREKILQVLNVDESELVLLGKRLTNPIGAGNLSSFEVKLAQAKEEDYTPPDEAIGALSAVTASLLKLDGKLKYWLQAFDSLPVPVIILRDGIVRSQNKLSKAIWSGMDRPLCDGCKDDECQRQGCEIKDAVDHGREIEKYKKIGDDYFKVSTSYFSANGNRYTAILITKINECLAVTEQLESINEERAFISQNQYEPAECYVTASCKVSYINESFLNLFGIQKDGMETGDDFHIMISKKLFYFKNVSKAAEEAKDLQKSSDVVAKLTDNRQVYFMFRPHVKANGEYAGVLVTVLPAEMYEFYNR